MSEAGPHCGRRRAKKVVLRGVEDEQPDEWRENHDHNESHFVICQMPKKALLRRASRVPSVHPMSDCDRVAVVVASISSTGNLQCR